MNRKEIFIRYFHKLLLQKIDDKKINLSKEKANNTRLVFRYVNGQLRYFIDKEILDELSEDVVNELENLWNSNN